MAIFTINAEIFLTSVKIAYAVYILSAKSLGSVGFSVRGLLCT